MRVAIQSLTHFKQSLQTSAIVVGMVSRRFKNIYLYRNLSNSHMAKLQRTTDDLVNKFKEQIQLLKLACQNYDVGNEIAALYIATTLRVLLHDTTKADGSPNSTSALTHINSKNIEFLNTCRVNNRPEFTFTGLIRHVISGVHDGIGGTANYYPTLSQSSVKEWKDFVSWWGDIVFQNPDGTSLTREVLVIKAANQEGGTHVDKGIDEKFDKFRHEYSGGVSIRGIYSGVVEEFDNVPVYPAIRQVGYEVLESLKRVNLA
jgi:hypothetical protein